MIEIDNCKLYNGNSVELLKNIPDNSIDLSCFCKWQKLKKSKKYIIIKGKLSCL